MTSRKRRETLAGAVAAVARRVASRVGAGAPIRVGVDGDEGMTVDRFSSALAAQLRAHGISVEETDEEAPGPGRVGIVSGVGATRGERRGACDLRVWVAGAGGRSVPEDAAAAFVVGTSPAGSATWAGILDPDHYLWTPEGRVFTPERGKAAFETLYADLEVGLGAGQTPVLHVVCGVQGSGKSTWVRANLDRGGPGALFLDAALPRAKHRARAVELANAAGVPAVAVWVLVPVETALTRNAARPPDRRVPEASIRNVDRNFEPPAVNEGFDRVIVVDAGADRLNGPK